MRAAGFVQVLLMLGGPLVVAALYRAPRRLPWSWWGAGAAAFVGSQVVHLPLLWLVGKVVSHPPPLVVQCALAGLLAGLCEEPARWLLFRRFLPKADGFGDAVFVGLGHGGIESMLLAATVLAALLGALNITPGDPATVQAAAAATLDAAPLERLAAVVERGFAITFHVAMSLVVLTAARRRLPALLALAIALHAAADAVLVWAHVRHGLVGAELVALFSAGLGVAIILFARRADRLGREARRGVVDFAGTPPAADQAISVRALTKEFSSHTAVDALTLDVAPGQVFALLGPNGAGKTTTVRMLCALIPPTRGTARVARALLVSEEDTLRARVGFLTETPGLYERLTAWENLDLFARLYGLDPKTRRDRIERHLKSFDLWERRDQRVSGFSKGMKQKVAIVRALVHEPEVLFLDEPTSGLDPVASREVQQMILALKNQGRTILLTTHRLTEAEELADLVGILRGKLLVLDTFASLKARMFGRHMVAQVANPSPALVAATAGLKGAQWSDGALTVPVEDPQREAPHLVRALVAAGADVVSVKEVNHSLEDVYLELVKGPAA